MTDIYRLQLADAVAAIPVGARYRHYKSPEKTYTIVGHGFWEATGEPAVIYRAEYGDHSTWIRSVEVFTQDVEWEGRQVPRFTRIDVSSNS